MNKLAQTNKVSDQRQKGSSRTRIGMGLRNEIQDLISELKSDEPNPNMVFSQVKRPVQIETQHQEVKQQQPQQQQNPIQMQSQQMNPQQQLQREKTQLPQQQSSLMQSQRQPVPEQSTILNDNQYVISPERRLDEQQQYLSQSKNLIKLQQIGAIPQEPSFIHDEFQIVNPRPAPPKGVFQNDNYYYNLVASLEKKQLQIKTMAEQLQSFQIQHHQKIQIEENLQKHINQLNSQNDYLNNQLLNKNEEIDIIYQKYLQEQLINNNSTNRVIEYQQSQKDVDKQIQDLNQQINQKQFSVNSLKSNMNQILNQNDQLNKALLDKTNKYNELLDKNNQDQEKILEQNQTIKTQQEQLQKINQELSEALKQIECLGEQNQEKMEEISQMQELITIEQDKIDRMTQQLNELTQLYEKSLEGCEIEKRVKDETIGVLENQIEILKNQLFDAQMETDYWNDKYLDEVSKQPYISRKQREDLNDREIQNDRDNSKMNQYDEQQFQESFMPTMQSKFYDPHMEQSNNDQNKSDISKSQLSQNLDPAPHIDTTKSKFFDTIAWKQKNDENRELQNELRELKEQASKLQNQAKRLDVNSGKIKQLEKVDSVDSTQNASSQNISSKQEQSKINELQLENKKMHEIIQQHNKELQFWQNRAQSFHTQQKQDHVKIVQQTLEQSKLYKKN